MAIFSRRIWRAQENRRQIMSGAARLVAPGRMVMLRQGLTHYQLDGAPDRPLLVCIHGWSTSSYVWDPLKPLLLAKGYRVLTYDLYGRGFSDRPDVDHDAALFTGQLSDLLDRLGLNTAPLTIMGYSMGGAIAAAFVAERLAAVERMALLAPAGMAVALPRFRSFARRNPALLDAHLLAALPLLLRHQFRTEAAAFPNDPRVASIARQQKRELDYRGYVPALLSSLKGMLSAQMEAEHRIIARSDVKVLALFAEEDTTIPYPRAKDQFDAWYPQSASATLAGAGHAMTYTHPEPIMAKIGGFLSLRPR